RSSDLRNSLSGKVRPARKVQRLEHCLNKRPGEVILCEKMRITRDRTERPRGALLYLDIACLCSLYTIGGRLRNVSARLRGGNGGMPPLLCEPSSAEPLAGSETVSEWQFDWGGRLLKGNGGAQRFPQNGWKSFIERKGRRELDCETYRSSRDESRT